MKLNTVSIFGLVLSGIKVKVAVNNIPYLSIENDLSLFLKKLSKHWADGLSSNEDISNADITACKTYASTTSRKKSSQLVGSLLTFLVTDRLCSKLRKCTRVPWSIPEEVLYSFFQMACKCYKHYSSIQMYIQQLPS